MLQSPCTVCVREAVSVGLMETEKLRGHQREIGWDWLFSADETPTSCCIPERPGGGVGVDEVELQPPTPFIKPLYFTYPLKKARLFFTGTLFHRFVAGVNLICCIHIYDICLAEIRLLGWQGGLQVTF
jgi:hypothetical protein